jgi:cell division protein FtsB
MKEEIIVGGDVDANWADTSDWAKVRSAITQLSARIDRLEQEIKQSREEIKREIRLLRTGKTLVKRVTTYR